MKQQIETARLFLAPATIDDFGDCVRYWRAPAIPRPNGITPDRESCWARFLKNHGHWQLFGYGLWLIREKHTSTLIGEVGFVNAQRETCPLLGNDPEFGVVLLPTGQRQGFAWEAASAVHAWSDVRWPGRGTIGVTAATNAAALRLTGKLGYRPQGQGSYHGEAVVFLRRRSMHSDSTAARRAIAA
jgi:RimJ/RimL family protein N-acetyltransferase